MRNVVCLVAALGLAGCGAVKVGDRSPPRLMETEVSADGHELALSFDEPLAEAVSAVDHGPGSPTPVEGHRVKVPLPDSLKPGTGHIWTAEVSDEQTNVTSVGGKFYAANPRPAGVRLNEVRVAGSGSHTDMIELRVEAGGSLGGWTVEAWSGIEARQRTVLPDVEVATGDLVVVRYRAPDGPTDAEPGTREFWQADAKGLAGTKGVVVLRQHPEGKALDGLLYSKKPGEGGPLGTAAGWAGPEFDPTGCTATRTWCRTEDTATPWIIVTSGSSTPGATNKLTPWPGPPSNRDEPPKTKG